LQFKDGKYLNSREGMGYFSWLKKQGKSEWWVFYFFIPWFFGLIRPLFCYLTFLKIPFFIEEISAFYDFFGNLFLEKNLPMVSSWRSMIHSFFHNDHS